MRGFIAALAVILVVVVAATCCTLYVRNVLDRVEGTIKGADDPDDLLAAADYLKKEKALLYLMAKESHIDKLITGAEKTAALWKTSQKNACIDALLLDLEAMKRSFGVNPL